MGKRERKKWVAKATRVFSNGPESIKKGAHKRKNRQNGKLPKRDLASRVPWHSRDLIELGRVLQLPADAAFRKSLSSALVTLWMRIKGLPSVQSLSERR